MDYLNSLCSGCGHPRSESFAKENFGKYHTEALRCHACADRDETSAARNRDDNSTTAGIYLAVTPKGD